MSSRLHYKEQLTLTCAYLPQKFSGKNLIMFSRWAVTVWVTKNMFWVSEAYYPMIIWRQEAIWTQDKEPAFGGASPARCHYTSKQRGRWNLSMPEPAICQQQREREVAFRQSMGRRRQAVNVSASKNAKAKAKWCNFDSQKSFSSPKNLQILSAKHGAQVSVSGFTWLRQFLVVQKKV